MKTIVKNWPGAAGSLDTFSINKDNAVLALNQGGVLLFNTDTLPGFHCRADSQDAVLRVAQIKDRDDGKPLLVLAGSSEQAQSICKTWKPWQRKICEACWPGPFSFILPATDVLAARVTAGTKTVAIRVPDNPALCSLILDAGFPLVSTSVNIQGQPPILTLAKAVDVFGSLVNGSFGLGAELSQTDSAAQPSAVVDLCGEAAKVLRPGPQDLPSHL